jgi:predicted nucleic acid-binding protein
MLVVADSGPVISLAVIGKLDLLEIIYGATCIGEAVWQEVSRYYKKQLLNSILADYGETPLD